MGKPDYPGKKTLVGLQCKPYDINLDEGFIAIKVQENKQTKTFKREMHIYTLTQSYMHIYICANAVLW